MRCKKMFYYEEDEQELFEEREKRKGKIDNSTHAYTRAKQTIDTELDQVVPINERLLAYR
jgi:hypothetical protein